MKYKNSRITIREFEKEDSDLLYRVMSDEKIMKYAYRDKFESRQEFAPYFDKIIKDSQESDFRREYELAVYDNSINEFIGTASLEIYKKNEFGGYGEIGYFLLPKHWGKGFATEIAKALLEICFNEIKLHKVAASCNENNTKSENVMIKAGMKMEGRQRKERFKDGTWADEIRYGILKEEWEK